MNMPDTTQRRCPVVDFDHMTPISEIDPDENWRRLRETGPVVWSDAHRGFWAISRHEQVTRVFKDHKTFSSARTPAIDGTPHTIPPVPGLVPQLPEELDPPQFHPVRRLLNGVLSPKVVATMRPTVNFWVTRFIDDVIERGECDLLYDLTSPLPGAVALGWLGFLQEDWRWISQAYHDFLGYKSDHPRAVAAFERVSTLDDVILGLIAQRREQPADDVISYLVAQEIDGEPLPTETVHGMVSLLIGGGVDTTTSLMTSTLVHLSEHPDQRRRLAEDPSLWDTATEEFLRRYPPIRSHARTVTQDVELGGCPMRRGDRVLVSERSACHDEQAFENPEEVVLDRFPNRHVAFGLGIHRCPGMHLARLQYRELVMQVLERMPDYHVDMSQLVQYPVQGAVAGWSNAPATFTPGPRRLAPDATPPRLEIA
jgi:cytochrome P450